MKEANHSYKISNVTDVLIQLKKDIDFTREHVVLMKYIKEIHR